MRSRCALITGGSGGIGYALSAALVAHGYSVISVDRVRPFVPIKGVTYLVADITKPTQYGKVLARTPLIDLLINNAGVMRRGTLFDSSVEDYDVIFGVNVKGSWLTLRYAKLAKNAQIVQMSSRHGSNPKVDPALYSLSKYTTIMLAQLVQRTRKSYDVRFVCPGPVNTQLLRVGRSKARMKRILERALDPQQFAHNVVHFLATKKKWLLFDEKTWRYRTK